MEYCYRNHAGDVTVNRFKLKHILKLAGVPLESWKESELEAEAKDVAPMQALMIVNEWNAKAAHGTFFVEKV